MEATRKSWYSSSLPNLKETIISRIESLHQKNLQTAIRSNTKNREQIKQHIVNKSHYQNIVSKMHEEKAIHVIQSNHQKGKQVERANHQHISRANDNYQRKEDDKNRNIERHLEKIGKRFEKAEENRKKFTGISKLEMTNKVTSSIIKRAVSICSNTDGGQDSFRNSKSVSPNRTEIREEKIAEREQLEMERSLDILNHSMTKWSDAKERREQLASQKNSFHKDQQILSAQQHCKKIMIQRQEQCINQTVRKHRKFNSRMSELNDHEKKVITEKQNLMFKQLQRVLLKKSDQQERIFKKREQELQKVRERALLCDSRKSEMLNTFTQTLRDKFVSRKQKLNSKIKQLQSENRKKNEEQLKKQKESWVFVTSIKLEKDRLISKNMYESAQLGLLRS